MKDYSELTGRIAVQLSPELTKEFYDMLYDIQSIYEAEIKKLKQPVKDYSHREALEKVIGLYRKYVDKVGLSLDEISEFDCIFTTLRKALIELEQLREFDRFCSMGKSIQYCKNEVVK